MKKQVDVKKLEELYEINKKNSQGGKRSCPRCKSRSWWQIGLSKDRQCNKCYHVFSSTIL